MTTAKHSVQLDIDDSVLPLVDEAIAPGDFDSLDHLASAALAEFLARRRSATGRYEELRAEIERRRSKPFPRTVSGDDVTQRVAEALDALDLPENG